MIKTVVNTKLVTNLDGLAFVLLPPNENRLSVVMSCNVGIIAVRFGSNPISTLDGLVFSTDPTLGIRSVQLTANDMGSAIQQAIVGFPNGAGATMCMIETLLAP